MMFTVTFVAGSAVIYVIAPMVGPRMTAYFRAEAPPSVEEAASPDVAGSGNAQADAQETARPANVPLKTLEDDDVSPALEGVFLARASEQPGWGITSRKTPYYKADGTYVGTLEGGILFDCAGTYTSSKGEMVECRFLKEGMSSGTFFVGRKDALFFTASHRKLSKARVRALTEYYQLSGRVEARRTELLEKGAERNPHFAAARASHEAYQKHIQDAKRLQQMRDTQTDAKRMEVEDKLREMKLKEVALKKTFEEAQDKFTAWKKEHAGELAKPDDDADIKAWTQRKKELAAALPGLAH